MEKTQVTNYILLGSQQSEHFKRLKRKLKRKQYDKYFTYKTVVDFENESIKVLEDYLKTNKDQNIGVLCDSNVLLKNITLLPPVPNEWDILCLESIVDKYNFSNDKSNIYWTSTDIQDSHNFVINKNSVKKVLQKLKQCKTWKNMIKQFNEMSVFTITQFFFSETLDNHVPFATDIFQSKKVSQIEKEVMITERSIAFNKKLTEGISKRTVDMDSYMLHCQTEVPSSLLPNVSLICILQNKTRFFHLLNTFLRINYPCDKLELIIIDDQDLEKQVKDIIPQDKRIKLINITQKNGKGDTLPLGYKINIGVKYASHDICYHFLDSNCYYGSKFETLIKHYILSEKDIVCSIDSGYYPNKSLEYCPDIGNVIYHKRIWNANCFEDYEDNVNVLLFKFLYFRYNCVSFLPFLVMSFNTIYNTNEQARLLPFDLRQTVDINVTESFNELNLDG